MKKQHKLHKLDWKYVSNGGEFTHVEYINGFRPMLPRNKKYRATRVLGCEGQFNVYEPDYTAQFGLTRFQFAYYCIDENILDKELKI